MKASIMGLEGGEYLIVLPKNCAKEDVGIILAEAITKVQERLPACALHHEKYIPLTYYGHIDHEHIDQSLQSLLVLW